MKQLICFLLVLGVSQLQAQNITAAEYFFNNDPGPGLGTPISVGTPATSVQFTASIPTTSLSSGFHSLGIRAKNANNNWGLFEWRTIYVSQTPTNVGPIVAAEYFIDTDPGTGNGQPLNIGTSGNVATFTMLLPTTSLSGGFHTLAVRVKTADGKWGLIEQRGFYIHSVSPNMANVTQAEYFIDTDPGIGNGTTLNIATPGTTINQSFLIQVPAGTPNGQHLLAIRAKDASGKWGLFEVMEFTVSGFPLPLDWLSFTGKKLHNKVQLQWATANEVNTSYFVVERSKNGVDFASIGTTNAAGQTENQYAFADLQPLKGLNYYRIKQIDTDGRFKYSTIVKVYFAGNSSTELKLFPLPAQSQLNIGFAGSGKEVFIQIYDAAGKLVANQRKVNNGVLTMETASLPGGTYWLVISDGITQQKAQFIKQ